MPDLSMLQLRRALEASWQPDTAYLRVQREGNPALGQCYPTSRVLQHYFPAAEIVEGEVITPIATEKHFWNLLVAHGVEIHIDLTWQQFPPGSYVASWQVRDRNTLGDGPETLRRVDLLTKRVERQLIRAKGLPTL
jgi:hypothetical protein